MNYILDTNICIYLIKKKPPEVIEKFKTLTPGSVGISSITLAELEYGVMKSSMQEKNQQALFDFLLPLDIYDFNENAALAYGMIRADLERTGATIGSLDLLIAAHAKAINQVLVTNNIREFSRVKGLMIENWVHITS